MVPRFVDVVSSLLVRSTSHSTLDKNPIFFFENQSRAFQLAPPTGMVFGLGLVHFTGCNAEEWPEVHYPELRFHELP